MCTITSSHHISFHNSLTATQERLGAIYENGRLHSYFTVMELVLNICAHPVTFASETSESSVQLPGHAKARTMFVHAPLSSYGEKEWTRIIKILRKGRNVLLRRDANAYILSLAFMQCLDPTRVDGEEDDPTNYNFRPIDASGSGQTTLTPAIIEAIESHHDGIVNELIDTDPDEKELDVFGTKCDKVLDQLELQKILSGLKATLTGIVMGHIVAECNEAAAVAADRPRTRSGASPARPKPPSKKELAAKKRQVQARIDGYLEDITALLTPPTANTAEGDNVKAAAFAAVRKTVKDFSAYLTNGLEHVSEKWAEKCLVRLEEVEVGLLAKLRDDAESLLRGWCTEVLDPPALVKCGYATQPLEEYSMPVPSSSAGRQVDDTVEVDEVIAGGGDNDDDDDHMPVPDDDEDDDDDEATVPKTAPTPTKLAMFDDVDSDVEMGVRVGGDEDGQEEESDIDESQPLLTQAPPGFDQHEASSSDEEEEEGAKEDAQMTPSRNTRRAADLKKKSLSTVITESAAAAAADSSSHKKPPASASQGSKTPATAPRRRKGSTGKTPVRRSPPPPREIQDDSDTWVYKGSPKRASTKAQVRKEDESSDDDTSDDAGDKKPKAAPRSRAASSSGKKKASLADDSSEEDSFDDDPFAPSSTKKTPSSRGGKGNAKSPKRTPRLSGTKLCTSSSSSEYEDTNQGDSSSSDDDEDIPSPSAKSRAVAPTPVPRIQPQSTRGVNVPRSAGKKRKRWTDEEKDIVRKGIARHGVGHWAMIKSDWPMELRDRTSVQIKDCYRTMLKRGELSESDSE